MARERTHPLQPLNSLRPLRLILVWLLALLQAGALASIPRNTFTPPALHLASVPSATSVAGGEPVALLTLHLDGLYEGGVLVRQNPWTKFDPEGLREKTAQGVTPSSGHHKVPVELWDQYKFGREAQQVFDGSDARVATDGHNATRHPKYSREVESELQSFLHSKKVSDVGGLSARRQKELAEEFVQHVGNTDNAFIKGFNSVVSEGPAGVRGWAAREGDKLPLKHLTKEAQDLAGTFKALGSESKLLRFGKRLPLVKYLFMGSAATGGYGAAKARGECTAESVAEGALEAVNPLPIGIEDVRSAGQATQRTLDNTEDAYKRARFGNLLD